MSASVCREGRGTVSVVMPCFNAQATVARSLESIALQEAAPLEVIAVDDGSRDATAEILAALEKRSWPFRFRVVGSGENRGPGEARNAGLDQVATASKYVAFLDADDIWLPWKLERQIGWMERHPACGWTAHRCGVAGRDEPCLRGRGEPSATPITRRGLLLRNTVATPAVVARRDLPVRFRPGWRHCEDLMLWLDWLDAGHEGFMLEETMLLLGRRPCTPGGSTGDLGAMHRGENRVLAALVSEQRMGRGSGWLWSGYTRVRYLRRRLKPWAT